MCLADLCDLLGNYVLLLVVLACYILCIWFLQICA